MSETIFDMIDKDRIESIKKYNKDLGEANHQQQQLSKSQYNKDNGIKAKTPSTKRTFCIDLYWIQDSYFGKYDVNSSENSPEANYVYCGRAIIDYDIRYNKLLVTQVRLNTRGQMDKVVHQRDLLREDINNYAKYRNSDRCMSAHKIEYQLNEKTGVYSVVFLEDKINYWLDHAGDSVDRLKLYNDKMERERKRRIEEANKPYVYEMTTVDRLLFLVLLSPIIAIICGFLFFGFEDGCVFAIFVIIGVILLIKSIRS